MKLTIVVIEEDLVRRAFFTDAMKAITDHQWLVFDGVERASQMVNTQAHLIIIDADQDAAATVAFCRTKDSLHYLRGAKVILMASARPANMTAEALKALGIDRFMQWPIFSENLKNFIDQYIAAPHTVAAMPAVQAPGETRRHSVAPADKHEEDTSPPAALPPEDARLLGRPPLTEAEMTIIGPERYKMIMEFSKLLEKLDYYQIMGLEKTAPSHEVKKRYYELARRFHPDRFSGVRQQEFMVRLNKVFKLMTEGYQILADPQKRKAYDYNLATRRNKDTLRMKRVTQEQSTSTAKQRLIKNANARKFYELGQKALAEGNIKGAQMNFTLAIQQAPGDQVIKDALERLKKKMEPTG